MWQNGEGGNEPEWRTVETEFTINLFGSVQTDEGPYAVGEGGYLVADRGDGWEIIAEIVDLLEELSDDDEFHLSNLFESFADSFFAWESA